MRESNSDIVSRWVHRESNLMFILQGLFAGCIYVGSGDPVRVLRLLHTTNTLDTLEAFIAETYVQPVATELGATVLVAAAQLPDFCCGHSVNEPHTVLYEGLNSELV